MADDNNKTKEILQEIEQKTKETGKEVGKLESRIRRLPSAPSLGLLRPWVLPLTIPNALRDN
jgi:hypothetical protein